jgi:hypothetical protein
LAANGTYSLIVTDTTTGCSSAAATTNVVVNTGVTYYADADNDTFGNQNVTLSSCFGAPVGYVADNTDCDDSNMMIHSKYSFYTDADGDGYGTGTASLQCAVDANTPPVGYAINDTDCDDNNTIAWQMVTLYLDADGDNYNVGQQSFCIGAAVPPGLNATTLGFDCNDNDSSVWRAEVLFVDADNDGYDAGQQGVCYGASVPLGFKTTSLGPDCNDNNSGAWRMVTLYLDSDGDNYNVGQQSVCIGLNAPPGFNANTLGFDCNDNDGSVWRNEILYVDVDNDGYSVAQQSVCYGASLPTGYNPVSLGPDCNDDNSNIHQSFPFFADADGDTYGNSSLVFVCAVDANTPPAGYAINNTDCNDSDNTVYQSAALYVDADNDGYTSGASQLVCYGATIPSGFVTVLTAIDCNDTIASIHPNAAEIAFNGIDDDCDGTIDETGTVTTTLLNTSCGTTLASIGSIIGITTLAGQPITGYRIRVTNGAQVQMIESNVPHFTMTQFASYTYATTYTVEIQLQRAGIWMASWGTPCLVSTPAILENGAAGSVNPSQCGITLAKINTLIATTSLAGVTGYRFRVTNLTDTVGPNAIQTLDRTQNWFSLQMLARYNYGTAYRIEVAVKTTGDFGGFGAPCEVSSPASPSLTNCGGSIALKTTTIAATSLVGITQYRFQVTRQSDNASATIDRSVNWFNFNMVPAAAYTIGAMYTVRVAVMSAGTWSPFGDACEIQAPTGTGKGIATATTANAPAAFKAMAYPNPFTSNFGIGVMTSSQENVMLKIYDMLGKLVKSREVKMVDLDLEKIGAEYPSGVYNVIVSQDGIVKTLRVIKR